MCGIAGIVSFDKRSDLAETKTWEMLEIIKHRGPDFSNVKVFDWGALGHCRLAILDLNERSNQPMTYKNLSIIFNGEIYNFLEIKKLLSEQGAQFKTTSDTEVILHSYKKWGQECVRYFRGMWAFVIYDPDRQELFFSRDDFGIKPLYYFSGKDRFVFCSEIKGLVKSNLAPSSVNINILTDYLIFGVSDHSEETFFKDIFQLPPGHNMVVNLETKSTQKYPFSTMSLRKNVIGSDYIAELKKSVQLHSLSDVPVGTCLSGGLDSSSLALLYSQCKLRAGDNYVALTAIVNDDQSISEEKYAEAVVDSLKMNWIKVFPTTNDLKDFLENCLYHQDEPVGSLSIFLQYLVMKEAHRNGIKVMLDGQGGDESLLGYERYLMAWIAKPLRRLNIFSFFSRLLFCYRNTGLSLYETIGYFVYFLFPSIRWLRIMLNTRDWITEEIRNIARKRRHLLLKSVSGDDYMMNEIHRFQLPHLLRFEDRNSMAHSVESRVPFVDKECISLAFSLPTEAKIKEGFTKYPLRELCSRFLPMSIAWRKNKIGFEAPQIVWMKFLDKEIQKTIENSALLNKLLKNNNKKHLKADYLWKLYNIALWEKQFDVAN